LDDGSRREIGAMLSGLPETAQEAVVRGMQSIVRLLSRDALPPWTIRHPQPGDTGWVIERHGALYAQEYGFNHKFEGYVAKVAGEFLETRDPIRERAWIAESDGVRLGSVFVVRKTNDTAQLRLLLVEPAARGTGLGKRLVEECITYARAVGYSRLSLWTHDILIAARGIYRAAGFQLKRIEPHSDFGPPMVGEEWELSLVQT
jgi:GNAT superfamily N-acetyltransferase